MTTYTMRLTLTVHNASALHAAAMRHAQDVDGLSADHAADLLRLDDGTPDVPACLQMLLDSDVAVPGAKMVESECAADEVDA